MKPRARLIGRRVGDALLRFFALAPLPAGAWKIALQTGITSSITLLVASLLFGTSLGPVALFGSMLAQWEVGRPLIPRIQCALLVGAIMTASMTLGISVAPERWLVIPVVVAIILLTTTAYYSFLLTRGPGPLHLFYAAAIGTYFGLFEEVAWPTVGITAFSTAFTGLLTLLYLIPDLHRPERQAVREAADAVAAYEASLRDTEKSADAKKLRQSAYRAVNRGWLVLQSAHIGPIGRKSARRFGAQLLDINRRLTMLVVRDNYTEARVHDIDLHTPTLRGRPSYRYLFTHGFQRHSIAWFTAWRIGLAAALAGSLTQLLGLGHPYWSILTASLVLHQWVGRIATTRRALHRAVGTLLGLVVVWAVAVIDPSPWWVITVIVVCIIGMCLLLPINYALAIVLVTPMSLLSIEATGHGGTIAELLNDRMVETLIGVTIATLVTWLTGLRAPRTLVRAQFRRTIDAIRAVLHVVDAGHVLRPEGLEARVALQFELLTNTTVLARATADDRTLADWHRVEIALADLGYATMSACWIANAGTAVAAKAAVAELDDFVRTLAPFDRDDDHPDMIASEFDKVRAVLTRPGC